MARAVNDMLRTVIDDAKSRGYQGYHPIGVEIFGDDAPSFLFIFAFTPLSFNRLSGGNFGRSKGPYSPVKCSMFSISDFLNFDRDTRLFVVRPTMLERSADNRVESVAVDHASIDQRVLERLDSV